MAPSACLIPKSRMRSKVEAATVFERESPPMRSPIPVMPVMSHEKNAVDPGELARHLARRHDVDAGDLLPDARRERVGIDPFRASPPPLRC